MMLVRLFDDGALQSGTAPCGGELGLLAFELGGFSAAERQDQRCCRCRQVADRAVAFGRRRVEAGNEFISKYFLRVSPLLFVSLS